MNATFMIDLSNSFIETYKGMLYCFSVWWKKTASNLEKKAGVDVESDDT